MSRSRTRCYVQAVQRNPAVIDYHEDVSNMADIFQRAAVDDHEVGFVALSNRAGTLSDTQLFRRYRCAGFDRVHGRKTRAG